MITLLILWLLAGATIATLMDDISPVGISLLLGVLIAWPILSPILIYVLSKGKQND